MPPFTQRRVPVPQAAPYRSSASRLATILDRSQERRAERDRQVKLERRRRQFQEGFSQLMGKKDKFNDKDWAALARIDPKTATEALEFVKSLEGATAEQQKNALEAGQRAADMVGRFLMSVRQIPDASHREQLVLNRIGQMQQNQNPLIREAGKTLENDLRLMSRTARQRGGRMELDDNLLDVMMSRYAIFKDVFKHEQGVRKDVAAEDRAEQRDIRDEKRAEEREIAKEERALGRALSQEEREGARARAKEQRERMRKRLDAEDKQGRELEQITHRAYETERAKTTGGIRPLPADDEALGMLPGFTTGAPAGSPARGGSPLDAIRRAARPAQPASP